MHCSFRRLLLGSLASLTLASRLQASSPPNDEFFEREVRPLLSEKCFSCHGSDKQEGGLRLDQREGALRGGDSGVAIVAGKPSESLLIQAVEYLDEPQMPPKGKLADREIAALRTWVESGAHWPGVSEDAPENPPSTASTAFSPSDKQRSWWAFQPLRPMAPPKVQRTDWARGEIDLYLLAEMEAQGLQPSPEADRRAWIRRATFDLTGLPPTPAEVESFVGDASSDAWEKVVHRLLESTAYGERWARHWLDVVRYADYYDSNPATRTASCETTDAWRYRDWVVDSLNNDLPFDQFIVHQIAGDLLPSPQGQEVYPEGLIATTFLTNGVWDRGDADKEKIVSDMADDNIDVIGKTFLGLTLGCARCHDHKFDPISQEDYYALAGMFYSSHMLKDLGAKGGEYFVNRVPLVPEADLGPRNEQLKQIDELAEKLAQLDKQTPPVAADDPQRTELSQKLDDLRKRLLPEPPMAMAIQEGGTPGGLFPGIQDVPIHIRGSYARLGPVVPRRLPRFLAGEKQPSITSGSGRRELAEWVASPENPLTPRVIVNRVWQWHFGTGIVRTPNNMGLLSEPPSHPELLDWLAIRFVEEGWSLKELHRKIMLSAAYRQSSDGSAEQVERDPENRWLARFVPRRLEAEAIRDAILTVAGRLERTPRGPAGDDLTISRRSLYVQTARWERGDYATLFDAANPDSSTEKRVDSTVAPQSLLLLNHPFIAENAKLFAERVLREAPGDDETLLHTAYAMLYGRHATTEEVEVGRAFLAQDGVADRAQAWSDLAHVLLCSNEFVYLD